jgi:hypothetical protein
MVPNEFVPTVVPQGQLNYQDVRANPQDFGSQLGQTLNVTGEMLEKHANERQHIINKAAADDLYATQYIPALADLVNEFYSLKGQDAENQYKDYQQKMINLQQQFSSLAKNPMQAFFFGDMAKGRLAIEMDRMARHAAEQSTSWQFNANDAVLNAVTLDGQRYWNDPAAVEKAYQNIFDQSHKFAALHGLNADQANKRAEPYGDKLLSSVLTSMAQHNPDQAQQYLEKWSSGQLLTPNVANHMQTYIQSQRDKNDNVRVDAATTAIRQNFDLDNPASNPADAMAYVRNPQNWKELGVNQALSEKVAKSLFVSWNENREIGNANQKTANENFFRAAALDKSIPVDNFGSWTDQQTGLQPTAETVERAKNVLATEKSRLERVDPDVVGRLTNQIYGVGTSGIPTITREDQIAPYIGHGITPTLFSEMSSWIRKQGDVATNHWMTDVLANYDARYKDANGNMIPGAASAKLGFIVSLNKAIKEGQVKDDQILDYAQRIYDSVDKAVLPTLWGNTFMNRQATPAQEIDWVTKAGGWPRVESNQQLQGPLSGTPKEPKREAGSGEQEGKPASNSSSRLEARTSTLTGDGQSRDKRGLDWVRYELGLVDDKLVNDDNINARYDQLKAWDPHFWEKLEFRNANEPASTPGR